MLAYAQSWNNLMKALLVGYVKIAIDKTQPFVLNNQSNDFVYKWKYLNWTVLFIPKFPFSNESELNAFYCSANNISHSLKIPDALVKMKSLYLYCVPN